MSVRVLRPGLLTTVQDTGRTGHQHEGVPVSGAMDVPALQAANLLVGNPRGAAALEVTLLGPSLLLESDVLLCVTGADLEATLDQQPLPLARAVHARAGARLQFGERRAGCRAYVALAGGIDVTPVLGSRSTYVRGALGGWHGRALRQGDVLPLGVPGARSRAIASHLPPGRVARWGTSAAARPALDGGVEVRALRGRHFTRLDAASQRALYREWFAVSAASDRMGYRLEGPRLTFRRPLELVSEAVAFGTVQLPPGGSPIVLLADRQTTGGYPRVLEVAGVDLPLLAQVAPGENVRFREISLEAAQQLYIARAQDLKRLELAIELRLH